MGNKKKKKNHVPTRLNILFFAVFLLFSALILRLGFIQIVQGEDYVKELQKTSNVTARIDSPRGLIYDRYGNILVDNELELSLTYTAPSMNPKPKEKLEIAQKLEQLIDIETDKITERDMKDYWILTRDEKAKAKLTKEDKDRLADDEEKDKKEYKLTLDRITEADLAEITDKEMRVLAIKREMDRGYALSPQRIKQGIPLEEAHLVSEYLSELPGIDILRDSKRKYVYDDTFRSIFGRTGAIPKEMLDYYLARGYDRSDIVGTSYLELQYEDVLRGQKGRVESTTSKGKLVGEQNEHLGERGNDLVLALDIQLQQQVEEIVKREVNKAGGSFLGSKEAYIVMMNPKTGEVLAMVGYDDHTGTVNKAFAMGSAVKGATVLTGFQTGVMSPSSYIYDAPITLPGGVRKKSVGRPMGNIDYRTALERSSNVYMFYIAMRMAGYDYGKKCCFNRVEEGYDEMRYYFSQLGLGVETGIDLPSEATGFNGGIQMPGNLLDLAIGQFDTYTTMQMAQYVSTIANGGYRVKPQLVKEIREPSTSKEELGRVVFQYEPTILNRIDMSDDYISRVQEGFQRVINGANGTGRGYTNKSMAGKTGTAQVYVGKTEGNNQSFIGYAPYDDPEVAFAVIVPNLRKNSTSVTRGIVEDALGAYYELKSERSASFVSGQADTDEADADSEVDVEE